MLIISTDRLIPMETNIITLQQDGVYYYLDRSTFESCIILSSKFSIEDLRKEFDSTLNNDAVDWFLEMLPASIKPLAPFLNLLESEIDLDLDDCTKALHIITNTISIMRYIGVPAELRKTVSFSLSFLDEAELGTSMFINSSIPVQDFNGLLRTYLSGGQYSPSSVVQTVPEVSNRTVQPMQQSATPTVDLSNFDIDTATVEDLRAHPDWEETGPGVFYNEKEDDFAFVDVPEDEEFVQEIADTFAPKDDEDEVVTSVPVEAPKPTNDISSILL